MPKIFLSYNQQIDKLEKDNKIQKTIILNGWNQAFKSPKDLEVFFCPFLEEGNFRNKKSMIQYQR